MRRTKQRNSWGFEMSTRLLFRLFLLFSPFLLWVVFEATMTPPEYFGYRFWEPTVVRTQWLLPTFFYPNMTLNMWTASDQDVQGPKDHYVQFSTDSFGYRNKKDWDVNTKYEFVITGDSNIVGSNIDEPSTLGAVLERLCGCAVYNAAPSMPFRIEASPWFTANPPQYFVIQMKPSYPEVGWYLDPQCHDYYFPGKPPGAVCSWWQAQRQFLMEALPINFRIFIDRISKQMGYNYLKAKMHLEKRKKGNVILDSEMISKNRIRSMDFFRDTVNRMKQYGTQVVFVVFPESDRSRNNYFEELKALAPTFYYVPTKEGSAEYPSIRDFYFERDSHWRENSVRLVANWILQQRTLK